MHGGCLILSAFSGAGKDLSLTLLPSPWGKQRLSVVSLAPLTADETNHWSPAIPCLHVRVFDPHSYLLTTQKPPCNSSLGQPAPHTSQPGILVLPAPDARRAPPRSPPSVPRVGGLGSSVFFSRGVAVAAVGPHAGIARGQSTGVLGLTFLIKG